MVGRFLRIDLAADDVDIRIPPKLFSDQQGNIHDRYGIKATLLFSESIQ